MKTAQPIFPHIPFRGELVILEELFLSVCRPGMIAFDLGSYVGNSSLKVFQHLKKYGGHLYCVDSLQGNKGADQDQLIYWLQGPDGVLKLLLQNLGLDLGVSSYVTVIIGKTTEVAKVVADGAADYVFLDADHRYSVVKQDLRSWWPKVRPGGIFCGHDFDLHASELDNLERAKACSELDIADGVHYGVVLAVSEMFPNVQWKDRIWWVRRES